MKVMEEQNKYEMLKKEIESKVPGFTDIQSTHIAFPHPEEPFKCEPLEELPEPYKSIYGERLKEIDGAAIIDDTAYTDNKQREWQICEHPLYLCMKMREAWGRGIDPHPKAMHSPRFAADLIVVNGEVYKNRFE